MGDGESLGTLSQSARTRLEELMMEGDLLEIELEETQKIWRILSHMNNNQNTMRKYKSLEEVQTNAPQEVKDVKKRGRKRKSEELELLKKSVKKVDDKNTMMKRTKSNPTVKEKRQSNSPVPVKRGPRKVSVLFLINDVSNLSC